MKTIRARFFFNTVNPKCAPIGGEHLKGLNHVTQWQLWNTQNLYPKMVPTVPPCSILLSNYAWLYYMYTYMSIWNVIIRLHLESVKIKLKIVRFSKSPHPNWLKPSWKATFCCQSDHCFGVIHGQSTSAIHCVLGRGVIGRPSW